MSDLPIALYYADDVKKIDKAAIAHIPISGYQLMTRAAQASLIVLKEEWPNIKTLAVICGAGNNGGDGYVLARLAKEDGISVTIYAVNEVTEASSPECKQAYQDWLATKSNVIPFNGQAISADVVVDAIVGTGARFPMAEHITKAIDAINNSKCPVFSLDIPSGLNADTGAFTKAVKANVTITFIAMKVGLVTGGAYEVVGKLIFDHLGITASVFSHILPCAWRIDYLEVVNALKPRTLSSHKGDNGHVCLIGGGQSGYSGAVCLAAEASLRVGAGLVSAVVAPESLPLLARAPKEVMCYSFASPKEMRELIDKATVIVLGPGLSQNAWGKKFFEETINVQKPLVVDADGLNWLARFPHKRENWVLTPHPGEAARLLNKTVHEVQASRIEAALLLKQKYGGIIVLKGAGSIVVSDDGAIAIEATANPVLATGGTGDVLAGLIGGLIAQKLPLSSAAMLALSVHAMSGELEATMGVRGMLASDLFLHIRNLINPES